MCNAYASFTLALHSITFVMYGLYLQKNKRKKTLKYFLKNITIAMRCSIHANILANNMISYWLALTFYVRCYFIILIIIHKMPLSAQFNDKNATLSAIQRQNIAQKWSKCFRSCLRARVVSLLRNIPNATMLNWLEYSWFNAKPQNIRLKLHAGK